MFLNKTFDVSKYKNYFDFSTVHRAYEFDLLASYTSGGAFVIGTVNILSTSEGILNLLVSVHQDFKKQFLDVVSKTPVVPVLGEYKTGDKKEYKLEYFVVGIEG